MEINTQPAFLDSLVNRRRSEKSHMRLLLKNFVESLRDRRPIGIKQTKEKKKKAE